MKTEKYNNMILAFQCDFSLAKDGEFKLADLDIQIRKCEKNIIRDIELLEELAYMIRYCKAEIHIIGG